MQPKKPKQLSFTTPADGATRPLRRPRIAWALLAVSTGLALGCTGSIINDGDGPSASSGGGPGTNPDNRPPNMSDDCVGWDVALPKRLIRLSFNQIATTMRGIFGDTFANKMITDYSIVPPEERTFPPLGDISEGSTYIDTIWQKADGIANAAGLEVFNNFAASTQCGDAPTTDCARNFVLTQAEKAFRHPLTDAQKTSLLTVYDEALAAPGATIQEAVQYSVYAIYGSPHFLYRTEFGANAMEGPLTAYEMASQLSYFVTDGPPDQALLAAAAANQLSTPEQIAPHVDRLLALPASKVNMESAILASLGVSRVFDVVIDPSKVPSTDFNAGVRASMFHETELFIKSILWSATPVSDLATSRKSFIDANLAKLYNIPTPTTGLDADGFGPVTLPDNRAGLLTMPGFLTSRSRPDEQSVVGRGLAVNSAFLCQDNPAFPEALASQIADLNMQQMALTERAKADYRAANAPCSGCHPGFDPYGVALENFETIGRFRTMDAGGRPIDASVTLPAKAGGTVAMNAIEVANALGSTGVFSACIATKLMTYALAETGVTGNGNSCATKAVADAFASSDHTFPALVKAVAVSKTLTHRTGS